MAEEKKSTYKGFTESQKKAHEKYMKGFCEVKVRMTPERRAMIQEYAREKGVSVTAFINAAIDAAMNG